MAKKFYGVAAGRKTGVFTSWDECKAQVDGFAGAKYKGFNSLAEAEAFAAGAEQKKETEITVSPDGFDGCAFVDGSFNDAAGGMAGGGGVLYLNGQPHPFAVNTEQKELCEMRNVGGEILSAMAAVEKAKELGMNSLLIYHDYEGIGAWATGGWKTNKAATAAYKEYMSDCGIEVSFRKVAAHTGINGNELADSIAKHSVGLLTHDEYFRTVMDKVGSVDVNRAWLDVGEQSPERFEQLDIEEEMA